MAAWRAAQGRLSARSGPATRSAKCCFQMVKICIFLEESGPLRQLSLAGGGGRAVSRLTIERQRLGSSPQHSHALGTSVAQNRSGAAADSVLSSITPE